jgi:hypothetical protein
LRSLDGRHDGRKITLPVAILKSDNPVDLTHICATALLDTGATSCAIAPHIIETLQLEPFERRHLTVATEDRLVDYFVFRVGLFDKEMFGNGIPFVFGETRGFGMRATTGFDVILGMDVLRQCDFKMDRSGTWLLSFG